MRAGITILVCFGVMAGSAVWAEDVTALVGQKGVHSVVSFGAKGDGVTDDTKAFQSALKAADKDGGGIAFVPTGDYMIKGHLNIPTGVTLEGVNRVAGTLSTIKGSKLLAVEGRGSEEGKPFIFLNGGATVKGVAIFYPEQDRKEPVPYPWCIAGAEYDCTVIDVFLVNPWNGIDFGTRGGGRHLIQNVYGQPLHTGIFVDNCYDVGRIQNVHFWPFWEGKLMDYTLKNATAFRFGRTDWEYIDNSFCICYKIGFHFIEGKAGPGNAVITNSGPDGCPTGLLVENCQLHAGIAWTNGQFMGPLVVAETNKGPVKFSNTGFWGPGGSTADLKGDGTVTLNACHFGTNQKDKPTIVADCRRFTMIGCDFRDEKNKHIVLGPNVQSAIIMGNQFRTKLKMENNSKGKLEMGLNLED